MQSERVTAEQVYQILINVESTDATQRKPAEEQLKQWETKSTKGFLASLTEIIAKGTEVHEQVRLLACIVAKNAVGSSWRKTLSTREWTKVDQDEKLFLRQALPEVLLKEPNNQIALQIALFLSNIVRFDFPGQWPDILDLLVKIVVENPSIEAKYRSVIALKYIFQALQTKVTLTAGFSTEAVQTAVKEARDMPRKVAEQFGLLANQCKIQLQEFAKATPTWQSNANLAIELLAVLENSIILVPDLELLDPGLTKFFETILECSQAQFQLLLKPFDAQFQQYYNLLSKCFFRNINCILSAFEKHTMKFCTYLMPFLRHYTEVLASFPRSSCFFIPRKVMKVTRFLTMVMVCPFFRHQFWESISAMLGAVETKFEKAKIVYQGLNQFLSPECLNILIESLIQNHLQMTPEEIESWQTEPETYIKDAEAPDSIHAYAEELLSAMFLRESEQIRGILINDVRKLQEHENSDSDEIVLLLDGCYRAIGVSRTGSDQVVDINKWYETELRSRIENPEKCTLFRDRVLLTRGLWLIRRFAARVTADNVDRIISSVLRCISSPDLVVSMQAIMTLHSFLLLRQSRDEGDHNLPIGVIVKECFAVLPKLKETENRIHILDLVSQLIRIVGYNVIEPHLEEIIGYLPALWSSLPTDVNQESGGEIRLQKSLVTLTSNIIQAIGPSALENPKVGDLALKLLQFTTNPKGQQALNMLDEGLQLWNSILRATPSLAQVLIDLYPRLFEILNPNIDPEHGLPILEGYILLGRGLVVQYIQPIVHSVDNIIGRCDYKESVLATKIIETLLVLFPDDTPKWFLEPTLRRMTRDLVEGEAIDRLDVNKKRLVPVEAIAICQVLARIVIREPVAFSALCSDNVPAQEKLLDQWLQCIANHSIEELFSTIATLGGLHQRKIVSIALLVLLDKGNPVVCENAVKVLKLIRPVIRENEKMAERIVRYKELQMKSQLDRQLDICERELIMNDPIDQIDIIPMFDAAIAKYPIPDAPSYSVPYLPLMEL